MTYKLYRCKNGKLRFLTSHESKAELMLRATIDADGLLKWSRPIYEEAHIQRGQLDGGIIYGYNFFPGQPLFAISKHET